MIPSGNNLIGQQNRWSMPFWNSVRNSLQFQISLVVVLAVLAIVGIGTAVSLQSMGTAIYESQTDLAGQWATSLAASAAHDLARLNDPGAIERLSQSGQSLMRWRAAACVAFADSSGKIISFVEAHPGLLSLVFPSTTVGLDLDQTNTTQILQNVSGRMTVIRVVRPVYATPAISRGPGAKGVVGYVLLGTDVSAAQARFTRIGRQMLMMDLATVLLVIPCTFLVTQRLASPLNQLARTARLLANGVMDARAPVHSRNEIGQLARSFNLMANRITQSQMELLQLAAELEQRVQERTHELEELASKDPLTGLHNRRFFGEEMAREFAAAERYHSDLTCLMFDLDHFKQINDRFGHRVGDDVLIALGQAIRNELRSSDIAARFGGDEFILLLPQTSAAAGRSLADRIIRAFAEQTSQRFPHVPTGLSVGIASLIATRAPSAETLANEADRALYEAKATGRGCMVEAAATAATTTT